jgi:hypothetical protein
MPRTPSARSPVGSRGAWCLLAIASIALFLLNVGVARAEGSGTTIPPSRQGWCTDHRRLRWPGRRSKLSQCGVHPLSFYQLGTPPTEMSLTIRTNCPPENPSTVRTPQSGRSVSRASSRSHRAVHQGAQIWFRPCKWSSTPGRGASCSSPLQHQRLHRERMTDPRA